jgi:hypothetical protein
MGRLESDDFGVSEMDLNGQHSNPRGPLEALLDGASWDVGARPERTEDGRIRAPGTPGAAIGAAHPRQGRIIDAITRVLNDQCEPMHARDVHAGVEALLTRQRGCALAHLTVSMFSAALDDG